MHRRVGVLGRCFGVLGSSLLLWACSQGSGEDQIAAARASFDKGDSASAVVRLKAVLQRQPGRADARLLLGKAMLEAGNPRGAVIEMRKALEAGAAKDEVLPIVASTLVALGEWDRVISEFADEGLKDPQADAELKAQVAVAYGLKGKHVAARAAADRALQLDPKNLEARLVLVRVMASEGNRGAALEAVEGLVAEMPKALPALALRAELLTAFGEPVADIRKAFAAIASIEPKHVVPLAAEVGLALREPEPKQVKEALRRLKVAHPQHPLTRYYEALVESYLGNVDAAYALAQGLLKAMPDASQALQLVGALAYQKGRYLEASALLGRALPQEESSAGLRLMLSKTYLRLGEPTRALTVLRPLLDDRRGSADASMVAAEAYIQLGDMPAAQRWFAVAAKAEPRNTAARVGAVLAQAGAAQVHATDDALRRIGADDAGTSADLALIAHRTAQREYTAALEAIDQFERKRPGSAVAPTLRGRVELLRGNYAAARKHFETAHALDAQYRPAVMALAKLEAGLGNRDAAIAQFQRLTDGPQGSMEAEMAVIGLRAEAGMPFEGIKEMLEKAIKRYPLEALPRMALARAMLDAGMVKQALGTAQDGVTAFPKEAGFLDLLAQAQYRAGDANQAMATVNKLASLSPTSPGPFLRMADIAEATGKPQGAIEHLQRALSLVRDFLPAQQRLVGLLVRSGKPEEAMTVARTVQKQRAKDSAGWVLEGDVERQRQRYAAAVDAYRKGLSIDRTTDLAQRMHGALVLAGQDAKAREFEAGWLLEFPRDVLFRSYLAERALLNADGATAQRQLTEVLRIAPDHVPSLNNLAWAQHLAGQPVALETIDKALKLRPEAPALLDTKANILMALGRVNDALAVQRRAVEANPLLHAHRLHLVQMLLKAGNKTEARVEFSKLDGVDVGPSMREQVKALRSKL